MEHWQTLKPCKKHPDRYCNCEGFVPACWDGQAAIAMQKLADQAQELGMGYGPKPCGLIDPSYHDCSNMKEVGGGFEGERYRCAVCGKGYFLDYEDMK